MFTMINGAMSDVSAADLQERLDEMRRSSLKPIRGGEPDFGQKLKAATQRRLAARTRITANASSASSGESFAEKVKRAVQKHPRSQGQARKNAEKSRARYHKPQRRQPTKGE